MVRTSTFANIGTDISGLNTSEEVLTLAGLNYNVVKQDMYFHNDQGDEIFYPDKKFTVIEGTDKVLGVVSSRYEICQNRDAFSFIDYIGQENPGFEYVKTGQTSGGLVYIIAKLPKVTILDDIVVPYIIFQNSHDGLSSIKATICPLRVVCQNQFNISFKQSPNTVKIIHSAQMDRRMLTARAIMKDVAGYMQSFESTANVLANRKISYSDVIQIFNDVFKYVPDKMTDKQKKNFAKDKNEFLACYNSDDNQNFIGTAWGVINGSADYLTHHKFGNKANSETTFINTTLVAKTLNQILQRVSD